jgi:hypothetical protein|tara:strand:+ start:184 stop:384 length:201 start_codon:yes stop_codon:yes gene_type:complete
MEKVTMAQGRDIEEILYEAHAYGLRVEVLDKAFKMQRKAKYKHVDLVSIYQEAFDTVIKQKTKVQL